MSQINIFRENQINPVADPFSAMIAVTRPILYGLLYSLKRDVVAEVGGYENVKLKMLPRLRRPGDGDIGICFEYAVHDAIRRKDQLVIERIYDALSNYCRVPGEKIESILFGVEKTGSLQLIDTAYNTLTDESRILTGAQAQPPKLKSHLHQIAQAFSRSTARESLPSSIKGLWKADLFLGYTDSDRWVGTTVKINPTALEGAQGLRIGITPAHQGKTDKIFIDHKKNLVVCPVPYDGLFMEVFYYAWGTVAQLMSADAQMPKEASLPSPLFRQVAQELVARREFSVLEVIEALLPIAQPWLLNNVKTIVDVQVTNTAMGTEALISPIPQYVGA